METILAATSACKEEKEDEMDAEPSSSILTEISQNSVEWGKRRATTAAVSKSFCFSSTPKRKISKISEKAGVLEKAIGMAKTVEREAGNWFVEYLEAALEKKPSAAMGSGRKGKVAAAPWSCPQAVLLKVVNWLEVEQGDSSKGRIPHPKAAQISRKLRIKVKNP